MDFQPNSAELAPPPKASSSKKRLFIIAGVIIAMLLIVAVTLLLGGSDNGGSGKKAVDKVDVEPSMQFVSNLDKGTVEEVKNAVDYLKTNQETIEFIDSMQADIKLSACVHDNSIDPIEFEGETYSREILLCPYKNLPDNDSEQNANLVLTYKGAAIISVQVVYDLEDVDSLEATAEFHKRVSEL